MIKVKRKIIKEVEQTQAVPQTAQPSVNPLSKFTSVPGRDAVITAMAKDLSNKTGTDREMMFFSLLNSIGFSQEDFLKLNNRKTNFPAKAAPPAAAPVK
jgi:hypothetical protein